MSRSAKKRFVLAGDLGGTNFRGALVDGTGRILHLRTTRIPSPATPTSVLDAMTHIFHGLQDGAWGKPEALALSMKGLVDADRGVSKLVNDFVGWVDVPVAARMKKALGLPVVMENDARCAALGEGWVGGARGVSDYVFVIVGTGIGTGLVHGGRLYRGPGGHAGEMGHTVVDDSTREYRCACGHYGHWEAIAAGPSLGLRARRLIHRGARDLAAFLRRQPGPVDGKFVSAALLAGVPSAKKIVEETGRALGIGLYNLCRAEDPSLIVLGGGVSTIGEPFIGPAREECARRLAVFNVRCPKIVPSALGDNAGLLGAATLAFQKNR